MSLTLTAASAVEPVSLSEAKAFLRVSHAEEDSLLSDFIVASREQVEALTGLALIAQSYREALDSWPQRRLSACGRAVRLARRPLISVMAVRVFDPGGAPQLINPSQYRVEPGEPGRLVAVSPNALPMPERPAGGIEVEFDAGFGPGPSDVPAGLREAILQLVAVRYGGVERAESAQRGTQALPASIFERLSPWRRLAL